MGKLSAALAALVVLGSMGAVGCGQSEAEKREQARQEAAEKRAAKERRERARQQAAYEACDETFADLLQAVEEMDSRLSVGLTYADYTSKVADVRVVYDQTEFGEVDDFDCLSDVGLPLERALNQYAKAARIWDECFEDIYCENDSIQGELQGHWGKASRLAVKADTGLGAMEPDGN